MSFRLAARIHHTLKSPFIFPSAYRYLCPTIYHYFLAIAQAMYYTTRNNVKSTTLSVTLPYCLCGGISLAQTSIFRALLRIGIYAPRFISIRVLLLKLCKRTPMHHAQYHIFGHFTLFSVINFFSSCSCYLIPSHFTLFPVTSPYSWSLYLILGQFTLFSITLPYSRSLYLILSNLNLIVGDFT